MASKARNKPINENSAAQQKPDAQSCAAQVHRSMARDTWNALTSGWHRDGGRPIAAGSFKTVYKGSLRVHVPGGASKTLIVAVLKMRRGDCSTEARMFLKLGRHPRLAFFLGQCVDGEDQLIVTEFAERGSLTDALETWDATITLPHNVAIMQQIAQGMEHLSSDGIIHRDLAARNVLVLSFDETNVLKTSLKITDYRLSAGRYNHSHVTIATEEMPVLYMPSESLEGGRFSEQSDVWACGVTFWCVSNMIMSLSLCLLRKPLLLSFPVVQSFVSFYLALALSPALSHLNIVWATPQHSRHALPALVYSLIGCATRCCT